MDEIVVQVCRAIACHARLKILSLIANGTEVTPTELANDLNMPLSQISDHLRRLSAAGLIQRRHSGVRCYCVAKSPYGETALSGKVSRWLYRILREPYGRRLASTGTRDAGSRSVENMRQLIFNAATAFTHLRRVQILRHLEACGKSDSGTMTAQLKMSPSALSRHCAKLARRGILVVEPSEHGWECRLAGNSKTRVHQELLEMIRTSLGKR
jgi:DNA-binding MarR family transcriptional regulator